MALKPIGGEIEAQVLNDNFSYLDERIGLYTETFEVLIPYDYPDLQAAVDHLSRFKASQGVRIVLKIASGHQLTKGLLVENDDFGMFRIEAEDAEVTLDPNFTGPSEGPNDPDGNLILGVNARMPVLACVINMNGIGHAGYHATHASNGYVEPNCGVKNAPFSGLECSNSIVWANLSVFTGCFYGYRAQQSGIIMAQGGIADDCVSDGVLASRGSTVQFSEGKARNSQEKAIRAQRSRIVAQNADLSGATTNAIYATQGSQISAMGANCSGAGDNAIYADECSQIAASGANCSNSGNAAIYAFRASIIDANGADARNSGSVTAAVHAVRGSSINANEVDTTGSTGVGFNVTRGSFIAANDGIGTLGQTANQLTNHGIIFQ